MDFGIISHKFVQCPDKRVNMHNKKAQNSGKVSSQPNALSFEKKKFKNSFPVKFPSSIYLHLKFIGTETDKDFCRNLILQVLNTGETIDLGFPRFIFLPPSLPPIFFY